MGTTRDDDTAAKSAHGAKERHRLAQALTDALDLERAVTTRQAAEILGAAEITLAQQRARGEGPPFFRLGRRSVRYRLGDVLAFRDERTVGKRKVAP